MKFLRDPLIQFIVLGAILMGVYAFVSDAFTEDESRRIAINEAEVVLLVAGWERQWRRPPTEEELRGLIDARVREEVLYREALSVGLDENDMVVRRRMVQKMEMLTQDIALLADPTDLELTAFFEERPDDYRLPPRISFSHIYFNEDRRGSTTEDDARQALAQIQAESPQPETAPERGDRFMLQYDYPLSSPQEVQRLFGGRFAEAVMELEPGWHGPIVSGYGLHLVNIRGREEGRLPEYTEVRERLVMDYNRMRSERANEQLFEGLSASYDIEIDEEAVKRSALQTGAGVSQRNGSP
jgi:hypothetical protein